MVARRQFNQALLFGLASGLITPKTSGANGPRTVCLDWALAETLIALQHPPIAIVAAGDWPRFVIEPKLPNSVRDLGLQQELNLEMMARLQPDLILSSPFIGHLDNLLTTIAPTHQFEIFKHTDEPLGHAKALTRAVAKLINRTDQADELLAAAEAEIQGYREQLSTVTAGRLLLISFMDERHVRVYGGTGLFQNVLNMLGLVNAWKNPTGAWGFATIGIERLAEADADHMISAGPVPAGIRRKLAASPLWNQLPVIKRRRISVLEPTLMFGAIPAAQRFARLLTTALVAPKRR